MDLKKKSTTKVKEGHYIMIKESIQEENITFIILIYATNRGAPKYIKQILKDIKGDINSNIIIAGDFNTSVTSMDRSSRQKIYKKILALFSLIFFFSGCAACGILVPRPGIEPVSPAVGAQSPNQWTTREFPVSNFFKFISHIVSVSSKFLFLFFVLVSFSFLFN